MTGPTDTVGALGRRIPTARVVSLVAAAVAGLAPALSAHAADELHFAYINKLDDNAWFVREVEGARQKADELGIEFTHQGVQSDANKALSTMETVIGAGVDGVIIVVPDQQIGPAILRMADEAGIPVIAVDDGIEDADGEPAPFVGFAAVDIGKQVGAELAELHASLGWGDSMAEDARILSVEVQSLSVCMDRTDNANAVLMETLGASDDDIIHVPYDPGSLDKALQGVSQTIVSYPQVERWLIHACNDDGVLGAVRALEQANYPTDAIAGVGINGQLACEEFKKDEPSGFRASVYVDSAMHGSTAVELMNASLSGGAAIPERTIIDGVMITREDDKGVPDCR